MTNIARWEPMREMMTLREAMDRLFSDAFVQPFATTDREGGDGATALPVDVLESQDEIVVRASVPGLKPEEIDISLTGDTLTIKGEHKSESELKQGNYIYRERRSGSFGRTLTLPTWVQGEKATAEFENGVLTLTLPKAEAVKPKTIAVKRK